MNTPLWFSNLLFWSVQVALLVVAAGFLPRLFQIRQPRVLLNYWRALLVITLSLPFVQPWHRPPSIAPATVSSVAEAVSFVAAPPPAPTRWHLPDGQLISKMVGIVILGGIVFRFSIFGLGLLKLRRFRETSVPIEDVAESAMILEQMCGTVRVGAEFRLSGDVDSPVTFGLARPVILLPERFLETDARYQSAIACHELLHVRRRDWVHHLAEEIVRAALWFHPAFAWLISRVRLAREQVVDREVLRLTQSRKPYLEALLEFAGGRPRLAAIPAPPFLAEQQLVERVALVLKEVRMSRTRLIASLLASSLCIVMAIALSIWAFPLKAAPRPAQSPSDRAANSENPILQSIQVKHYEFDASALKDRVLNDEHERMEQLSSPLTVEHPFQESKANQMTKLLRDFWQQRGLVVGVRWYLAPSPQPGYATLEFDVYKQTILPGRLEGGVAKGVTGGVSGGVSQGVSGNVPGEVAHGASGGVAQGGSRGIAAGVGEGVSGGIAGGVSGEMRTQAASAMPAVGYNTIWTDTVKRGPMVRQVRGLGKLVSAEDSTLVVRIAIPVFLSVDVRPNQSAAVDTRMGVVKGHVVSIDPSGDTCSIEIALDAALPERATVGLSVDATIAIEKLENVLYVGRPVHGDANTTIGLFKISKDGLEAQRVSVKLGRSSVNTIEILQGLQAGDKIILSDMSDYDNVDRIRLTNEQPVRK